MKVEKNIRMPRKYPFDLMEVSDSFAVPSDISRQAVLVSAKRWEKKNGGKFVIRMMPDKSFRCWRVA